MAKTCEVVVGEEAQHTGEHSWSYRAIPRIPTQDQQQQYRELEDQYCQVLAAVARADQPGVGGVKPRPVQRDSRSASCLHDLATRTTRGEQPDERASRGEHSESARQSKQQHLPLSGSTGGADRISRVSHDTFHLSWQRSRSINRSCQWRTSRCEVTKSPLISHETP